MEGVRVLAVIVTSGKVGFALFRGQRLTDWGSSRLGSLNAELAKRTMQRWIKQYRPDVVVTEAFPMMTRKGDRTRRVTQALSDAARDLEEVLVVSLERQQVFDNKYDEAEALAREFPELEPYLPRRPRLWETEPTRVIMFEAVSLAKQFFINPSGNMLRAMG